MPESQTLVADAGRFATDDDHAECRRIQRRFGPTYYLATLRFPGVYRRRTHAIYAFVRVPDEWVDNPGSLTPPERRALLANYREQLMAAYAGERPRLGVLRAFADVAREAGIGPAEPLRFLDAMESDLDVTGYATYDELRGYMRGSACAVGRMMCAAIDAGEPERLDASDALAEAMQLTNFLRDVAEDARRGRVYLPGDEMARFGVSRAEVMGAAPSERFQRLMAFQIARARAIYAKADEGIACLPAGAREPIRVARALYAAILDRLEGASR